MTTASQTPGKVVELALEGRFPHSPLIVSAADLVAEVAIDALLAAGYAMVKLPEPDITEDGVTDWECAPYRITTLEEYPGEVFPAYLGEPEEPLTPQDARALAAAYLAAADAAERGES